MPIGNILVGDAGCDVEHDDTTLAVDVVPIPETTEFLLSCCIPDIELDPSEVLEYHEPAEFCFKDSDRNVLLRTRVGGPQHQGLRYTSFRTHRLNGA